MAATEGNQSECWLVYSMFWDLGVLLLHALLRLPPSPLCAARSFSAAAACLRHFPPQLNTRDDDEVFLTQQYFVITSD